LRQGGRGILLCTNQLIHKLTDTTTMVLHTVAGGRSSKAKAREYKASGNKAMAAGAFPKAMRQYSRALELDPGNAILYSNRSATHFNLRQFAESLEDAESAILCDEKWWKAYKRKGLALIHMQRYEEAIEALEQGLAIIGKNAEMEKNLEFARACQEQAQNLYILPEAHMMNRLESVPVFIVTDDVGQPFFVTYEDGQQVCTFYFDKVDADATLKWIQDENPDIGTTARVIHITLNQAFTLAQETQKQYYEETTRAAVEEDLASAREAAQAKAAAKSRAATAHAHALDVDADEAAPAGSDDAAEAAAAREEVEAEASAEDAAEAAAEAKMTSDIEMAAATSAGTVDASGDTAAESEKDAASDDALIDENAPLSFQFRPELRQVQVAVELLNKNPNPPVRPILRDPPSVKEAKAKAKAEADAAVKKDDDVANNDKPTLDADAEVDVVKAGEDHVSEAASKADSCDADEESPIEAVATANGNVADGESPATEGSSSTAAAVVEEDDDDVELTVENFNGIPVFQAKGLTLLQNGMQHIPLFCSKWDLEAAWDQLVASQTPGVSGKCEVEVGTLEDVLRRMSESKTGEYENVIFVPSREAMDAIGQKFPLDDLAARRPKPVVKKANYSRAKEIKARGGTQEEIRAAITEDLKVYRERQRMAEIVAQLNQTPLADQAPATGESMGARARRSAQRDAKNGAPAARFADKAVPAKVSKAGNTKEVTSA
jgi:tetratricopeptide (TPR) repeat protein